MKPVIGITLGDAAGVGPEIIAKALAEQEVYDICRPVVIGDLGIMKRAVAIVGQDLTCRAIDDVLTGGQEFGQIDVIDLRNLPADLPFAQVDPRAGKAAYTYVETAVNLALAGKIAAIATAPLNKDAMNQGGCHFPGHTEILAHLSNTKNYAMMLTGGSLRVIHVSTHLALRQACEKVKKERVLKVIELADQAMKKIGIKEPRIAVAGLNPHSGEGGLFGTEEIEEIIPAIECAKALGLQVTGPVAPDTVFYRAAVKKDFDIVVVMYHDQGHIPLKVLGFEEGVNITVGLPFIRTSVDHGTAFDIAGKGIANHMSMLESIRLAALMAEASAEDNK
ncbi:4-hydroxythreonine-4-phosphate dehydrogenase [Anaerospora hongkongensis]|jgi:4-hydroxythreonine-4-phosphate dehydrogenase|uniref:4-hydroxythreonine-4-phosphate dehydrogenase n=1 Tax=Anaerospora hongkongensis TaxID=244830 RepID=A0A4R1Q2E9_9FIRM|nr:4-hydroxythreonine-4-phosphate dehydrogenase PdxA [Anaerospora hongkongensis]TCL37828.1 4-hydroxythreonine-4-phosphate dehydrogenase [Anaerospora hongkongensis]